LISYTNAKHSDSPTITDIEAGLYLPKCSYQQ